MKKSMNLSAIYSIIWLFNSVFICKESTDAQKRFVSFKEAATTLFVAAYLIALLQKSTAKWALTWAVITLLTAFFKCYKLNYLSNNTFIFDNLRYTENEIKLFKSEN